MTRLPAPAAGAVGRVVSGASERIATVNDNLSRLIPRFSSKVEIDENGCWRWTAALNRAGYGLFMHPETKRMASAHRYSYQVVVGPIPPGLQIDHLCRVRNCVNPDHLEPVTCLENVRRALPSHCPSGHPYAGDNLYVNPRGDRFCRECHRRQVAAYRAAHPERARAQDRAADARYKARKRAAR